jgi:GntR family transcriptional regulator
MSFRIDPKSKVPIGEQIFNGIIFAIRKGIYREGDKLPSVRELSAQLLVNPNTVAKVFRDLETRGFIQTKRGVGAFVRQGSKAVSGTLGQGIVEKSVQELVGQAQKAGMPLKEVVKLLRQAWKLEEEDQSRGGGR